MSVFMRGNELNGIFFYCTCAPFDWFKMVEVVTKLSECHQKVSKMIVGKDLKVWSRKRKMKDTRSVEKLA